MSDVELLQQMKRGDLEAWRSLYARYLPTVWRFISARVGDMHAAEDILSETMLGFFSAVDGMDDDSNIVAWLRSVAHNKVRDHYRKQGRRQRLVRGVAESHDGEYFDIDRLAGSEIRESVVRVLKQLTEHERLALEWKYIDGESVRTIAERLGLSVKAAESLLYRGRRAFRKWFDEQEKSQERRDHAINGSSDGTFKS